MASKLDPLALRFCKALKDDTAGQPMQWRAANAIGIRARIREPKELAQVVAHAIAAGWLEQQDGHSVMLTEAGRRL